MYSDLKEAEGRFYLRNFGSKKNTPKQTGEFEKYILCAKCENDLGSLDGYANNILKGHNEIDIQDILHNKEVRVSVVNGIDYKKFKLFLLSLLWRISISKRNLFKLVELSELAEEQLREMILNKDPKGKDKFPCVLLTDLKRSQKTRDLISQPKMIDENQCIFIANGLYYWFYFDSQVVPTEFNSFYLNELGKLEILHIPNSDEFQMFNEQLLDEEIADFIRNA
jgi:hypothetical protein